MNLIYQALYLKDSHIVNEHRRHTCGKFRPPPPPIFREVSALGRNPAVSLVPGIFCPKRQFLKTRQSQPEYKVFTFFRWRGAQAVADT